MKKYILALLLFSFTALSAQEKYLIYFKDKGSITKESLSKSANKEKIAKQYLSERSIERRKKTLGKDYFSYDDLPVERNYVNNLKSDGIKIVNKLKWFNAVSAYLDEEQIDLIKSKNFIKKIERIRKTKSITPIKNPQFEQNSLRKSSALHTYDYGLSITQNELSDIPEIHDMGITGDGVIIGILDTGFDWTTHQSLRDRTVIAEKDFIYNDNVTANDSNDVSSGQHNHGTSVFSILAGFDEGKLVGPSFNANFLLAKTEFVPSETHAEEDNYAAALEWMDSIGVDITTSSLGYSEFDPSDFSYTYEDMNGNTTIVTKAAELAFDRGIVVITSAGNEGNTSWKYITAPGDGFNTITIGAVTSANIVTSFSSVGPTFDGRIKPEVVAMGSSVINAIAGSVGSYSSGAGTSFSAPISAGVAGLLLSAYPHLNNNQVRSILIESGDNVDTPNNERGYGLISALRAITYPNLEKNGSSFTLHKIFDNSLNINESTVQLVFGDGSKYSMLKSGRIYSAELPMLTLDNNYEIYFTYKDSSGTEKREPANRNYKIKYGQLNVDLILTDTVPNVKIPKNYSLSQNYPNPFNPSTTIKYTIPENNRIKSNFSENVVLNVYDILGTKVRTLINKRQGPGNYSVAFSAQGLSSGIYFYQLRAGTFTQTRKLTILK